MFGYVNKVYVNSLNFLSIFLNDKKIIIIPQDNKNKSYAHDALD